MITAKEAFERSARKNSFNELLSHIDRKIRNATESGDFHCVFCITYSTDEDLRLKVTDTLMRNGYHIDTKLEGDEDRDPAACYYVLTITWDKRRK